jgi:hypothetical protein
VVAQDRTAAQVIMDYISGNFHSCAMLEQMIERESVDRIDLTNRISIRVHTCTIAAVRGPTVLCCLADEIAFWKSENSTNPDEEVIASMRPSMATVGGGLLLCASSPYARKGALWRAYQKHYGKEGDPVLVWQASSKRMNPTLDQALIDAALERDPAKYAAEYLATFRTDVESFVSLEVVQACTDTGVFERPPSDRFRYFGFTDPSGGSGSSFSLAICHIEHDSRILDLTREVRPPFDPSVVVREFSDVLKSYRIRTIGGDHYAGEWPREAFRREGITYRPCRDPKAILYANMLPLLNSGQVRLLDDARLRSQLINLERNTGRSGRDSIAAADNGRDDVINAVAGAFAETTGRPKARIGTWCPVGDDPTIHWKDAEQPRTRIHVVRSEEEWERLRKRGLVN